MYQPQIPTGATSEGTMVATNWSLNSLLSLQDNGMSFMNEILPPSTGARSLGEISEISTECLARETTEVMGARFDGIKGEPPSATSRCDTPPSNHPQSPMTNPRLVNGRWKVTFGKVAKKKKEGKQTPTRRRPKPHPALLDSLTASTRALNVAVGNSADTSTLAPSLVAGPPPIPGVGGGPIRPLLRRRHDGKVIGAREDGILSKEEMSVLLQIVKAQIFTGM